MNNYCNTNYLHGVSYSNKDFLIAKQFEMKEIYIPVILTNVLSGCYSYDILYINFLALGYAHR
jgi:hypothetical protein